METLRVTEARRAPERQPPAACRPDAPVGAAGNSRCSLRSWRSLSRTAGVVAAVAWLSVGCSNAAPSVPTTDPPEAVETEQPEVTEAAPATEEPQAPAATEAPGEPELLATWEAFHTAWTDQAPLDQPDPDAFDGLAVDPQAAVELLAAQRGDARTVTTEAELWPVVVDTADPDAATISDCVIVTQHPDGQPDTAATVTVGWEATATLTDDGWRIDTAQPTGLFCIAEELNEQLLSVYSDYRAGLDAAWDPPDPEHPALEATMAGEQLDFIRGLLTEHQTEGIVIREPASTDNAVVFELGIGTATVSDCTEQVEGYGAFDRETGERLDDVIAPVEAGRLDAQSVDLRRMPDGSWRVIDQAASRDTDCVVGSTRYVVS
jgi:hypothetical protein